MNRMSGRQRTSEQVQLGREGCPTIARLLCGMWPVVFDRPGDGEHTVSRMATRRHATMVQGGAEEMSLKKEPNGKLGVFGQPMIGMSHGWYQWKASEIRNVLVPMVRGF